jgi:hypothetical protein
LGSPARIRHGFCVWAAPSPPSAKSRARLFFGVTAPLIGYVADRYTLEETLFFQAALLVLIFSWMFVRYATIPKKYFEVKESVSEHL